MTDVLLYQTTDGGEINATTEGIEMTGGLETAVYLSLFGGNEDASRVWWGDIGQNIPDRITTSFTQNILRALPAVPANLLRVKSAAEKDLAWVVKSGRAQELMVSVGMPGVNQVKIVVAFSGVELEFVTEWSNSE